MQEAIFQSPTLNLGARQSHTHTHKQRLHMVQEQIQHPRVPLLTLVFFGIAYNLYDCDLIIIYMIAATFGMKHIRYVGF